MSEYGGLFIELIRLLEVLFDEVDEMEMLEKIMRDERAYQLICKLMPNPQIEKHAV